jgi:hypothetical protein
VQQDEGAGIPPDLDLGADLWLAVERVPIDGDDKGLAAESYLEPQRRTEVDELFDTPALPRLTKRPSGLDTFGA